MITLGIDTSTAHGALALLRDDKPLAEETFWRPGGRGTGGRVTSPGVKDRTTAAGSGDPAYNGYRDPNLPVGRETSPGVEQHLFGALADLLAREKLTAKDIDLITVGIGPGSFTGIRVGIAAAKGLALPGRVPIKGIGSFDAVALTALPRMPRDCPQMCVLCDARHEEVYFALYDAGGRRVRDCAIAPLEEIANEIHAPFWFVSSEIGRFAGDLKEIFGGFASVCEEPVYPSAAALGWLGLRRFREDDGRGDAVLEPIYLRQTEYKKSG